MGSPDSSETEGVHVSCARLGFRFGNCAVTVMVGTGAIVAVGVADAVGIAEALEADAAGVLEVAGVDAGVTVAGAEHPDTSRSAAPATAK